MNGTRAALELLPTGLREKAGREAGPEVEELRLRLGQPVSYVTGVSERRSCGPPVRREDLYLLLEKATGAALHAAAGALEEGYYCKNGVRIGVCGQASGANQNREPFRNITSLSLRIPRECRGILDGVKGKLLSGRLESTLILAPPGGGKTTALRELIRLISQSGIRVGVADERMELFGGGVFDLGPCTDVLSCQPKARAAMQLMRAMNPQVIAMDEIGGEEDAGAVRQLFGCGITLLASIHARDRGDLERRPACSRLLKEGCFQRLLIVSGSGGNRRYWVEDLG